MSDEKQYSVWSDRSPYFSEDDDCFLVPLTQGMVAKIDEVDVPLAANVAWHFSDKGYARRESGGKMVLLHRLILSAPSGVQVDHVNGDRLDNRRANLRLCTAAQNAMNAGRRSDNMSGYTGVNRRANGRWGACINHRGERFNLGTYDTAREAASVRDIKAVELRREYARLNLNMEGEGHVKV